MYALIKIFKSAHLLPLLLIKLKNQLIYLSHAFCILEHCKVHTTGGCALEQLW